MSAIGYETKDLLSETLGKSALKGGRMEQKKKPIHDFKIGKVKAVIWKNETKDQETWFNVEFSRFFKQGEKWRDAKSFRRDDLPILGLAIDMAYRWIWNEYVRIDSSRREQTSGIGGQPDRQPESAA